jgi:cytochrome P450
MSSGGAAALDRVELPFLDVSSQEYIRDPFSVISKARAADRRGGRIMKSAYGVEILDYEMGRKLLTHKGVQTAEAKHYKDRGAGPLLLKFMREGKLTAQQGERHLLHRRILNTQMTPQAVARQGQMYYDVANRLIDRFFDAGHCELIEDFTHPYPFEIFCRALSIPVEDVPIFDEVTRALPLLNVVPLAPHVDAIEKALQVLIDYTTGLLNRPEDQQEGFVAELAQHMREGTMERDQTAWSLVTLLQASHYTTRTQLASIVRLIIETGAWSELVADKSLIPGAVEEGMRFHPVVSAVARVVNAPGVEFDGVEIPEGTFIRFNYLGAGRDPNRFDHPDRFDIHRKFDRPIPFGYGAHKCLGHTMARKDMEVAVEVMINRLKNPRIVKPIQQTTVGAGWGPDAVHLEFDR